jgi:hypothetical protein
MILRTPRVHQFEQLVSGTRYLPFEVVTQNVGDSRSADAELACRICMALETALINEFCQLLSRRPSVHSRTKYTRLALVVRDPAG